MEDIKLVRIKKVSKDNIDRFMIKVANKISDDALYRFLIDEESTWKTIKEFDEENWVELSSNKYENSDIVVQYKHKDSDKIFEISSMYHINDIPFEDNIEIQSQYSEVNFKIIIDRKVYNIGEKVFVKMITSEENLMYRYWIKNDENWILLKDYSLEDAITFTATSEKMNKIRVEAKRIDSICEFEYEDETEFEVKEVKTLKILDIKTVSSELLVDEEIAFQVDAEYENNRLILYKFIKIDSNGNNECIQDFSTKKLVTYKEQFPGEYRLLCIAKDLYSVNEFDDRAILKYSVKAYRAIEIHSFTTDVCSPQPNGAEILLKAFVTGGKNLLYRYIIKGNISEDSGFISDNTYLWKAKETGKYLIELRVKDAISNKNYDANSYLDFVIDETKVETLKIDNVIFNKNDNILINEKVSVEVVVSGGFEPLYSFMLYKDGKHIEKINYGINNWVTFVPSEKGKYALEIKVRDRYSNREYDSHSIRYFTVNDYVPAKIEYILTSQNENYVVGDKISMEIISEGTKKTLVKYKLYINGHFVEESSYSFNKKFCFDAICSGKYYFEFHAKNIDSSKEYDSKCSLDLKVEEATPVTNATIMCNQKTFKTGIPITINADCEGGKRVIYEFYLMENGEWRLVQKYSSKSYYTFVPFSVQKYKILVLCKSMHSKKAYEDFCEFEFVTEKGLEVN
ncbi:Y_Y_Y domain protein [Clostridium tepidiprofundi DSM 19306]|uniref:Y_Y_Y domain protein n=1 Tax=Clostridium tepidiprofundi DSM 19306 TaxID=1121338 RepID=A0A151AZM2_9CLOT|nr:triple tyrosine motif-containing protein [Clostridium tepidiprofundi]KYH32857.1 Y_Y_Y domain protein [Clostridium tepidiprofundi DSM 19306]